MTDWYRYKNPADLEEAFLLSETDILLNQDSTDIERVVELVKSLLAFDLQWLRGDPLLKIFIILS